MHRIQIQLPKRLHDRAKRLASAKEISFSELARRALEVMLDQSPAPEDVHRDWRVPTVSGLGWKDLSHQAIKEAAQRPPVDEELEKSAQIP